IGGRAGTSAAASSPWAVRIAASRSPALYGARRPTPGLPALPALRRPECRPRVALECRPRRTARGQRSNGLVGTARCPCPIAQPEGAERRRDCPSAPGLRGPPSRSRAPSSPPDPRPVTLRELAPAHRLGDRALVLVAHRSLVAVRAARSPRRPPLPRLLASLVGGSRRLRHSVTLLPECT